MSLYYDNVELSNLGACRNNKITPDCRLPDTPRVTSIVRCLEILLFTKPISMFNYNVTRRFQM